MIILKVISYYMYISNYINLNSNMIILKALAPAIASDIYSKFKFQYDNT